MRRQENPGEVTQMLSNAIARPKLTLLLSYILVLITNGSLAARNKTPFQYEECKLDHSIGVGKDNVTGNAPKIIDGNFWASTFTTENRMPHMARLDDPTNAWTASVQNTMQFLAVDLGSTHIVTRVYTQGRQGSNEYVIEFTIEFSMDNKTWKKYTDDFGLTEIFKGNNNSNDVEKNNLIYPIIARYIKFKPQRWNQLISMRVDVIGCRYVPEPIRVSNDSYVMYDMANLQSSRTEADMIILRFRTTLQDGVLLYADGNQGDYIAIELKRGYLHFEIDLGSTQTVSRETHIVLGSMLDDGEWHDVIFQRNAKRAKLVVDRLELEFETKGLFFRLDLDKKIYLGGVDTFNKKGLTTRYNFNGCIDFVRFNGINIIRGAKLNQGFQSRFQTVGPVSFSCSRSMVAVTDV